ncbi:MULTISPECIES: glycoside hydrolase family 16 protein [unclassified Kitasatospora]|uniref:glycoside hydrolase family 16 protein n=1 Tax=unclassified Kitasatospora TaxID=2633591 RepID=UPI0033CE0F05
MAKHSKHRRSTLTGGRRFLALGIALAATGTGAAAWAMPSTQTEPVVVDSISITPTGPGADSPVTATAKLHATRQTSVQALTIAVRSADGAHYDFRGAIPATLTSSELTFTPQSRTFPAGTYTYFVAYESANHWHNLSPVNTFTSRPSSAPAPSPSPTATGTATATATASPTATGTPSPTATGTPSPTTTATSSPTATATQSPTATATTSPSPTTTATASPSPTATATATATPSPTATTAPTTGTSAGPLGISGAWRPVFADEFNGSSLDAAKWNPNWFGCSTCTTQPVNSQESAAYSPSQVSVSGGSLHLAAVQKPATVNGKTYPYTSGLINTNGKAQFSYGAFEARIYLPPSGSQVANWPAFWTDGQNWPTDGEMDVMEGLGGEACYHFHSDAGGPGGCAHGDFSGWHTYGAEWAPGSVTYYYDGVKVGQITTGITAAPMYLILNNAVDSKYPAVTPADMQVDYVRVWQH